MSLSTSSRAAGPASNGLLLPPCDESESVDYDLYQRYSVTARILDRLLGGTASPVRILELGPNYLNPLPRFLDARRMTLLRADVKPVSSDPDFLLVQADLPLPFGDESFDAVVALEVLEHMPADRRPGFVSECLRIARHGGVFSCPNGVPEVVAAEAYAADSFRRRHGIDHPFLEEHRRFGLPHPDEIIAILRDLDVPHAVFDNAPLDIWLPMLLISENLLERGATGRPQLGLNRYFLHQPIAGPLSYRKIYVCAKTFDATAALGPLDDANSCGIEVPNHRPSPVVETLPAASNALMLPALHHLAAGVADSLAGIEHERAARTAEASDFCRRQYTLNSYVRSLRGSRAWKLMTVAQEAARFFRSRGLDASALIPWSGLDRDAACPETWRITGPGAHCIVPCYLPAGWLRIRLCLCCDQAGEAVLSFDNCDEGLDAVLVERFALDGRLDRDYQVYLPRPTVGLRFYPLDVVGTVRVEKLEILALSSAQVLADAAWDWLSAIGYWLFGRMRTARTRQPLTSPPSESTREGMTDRCRAETPAADAAPNPQEGKLPQESRSRLTATSF